MPQQEEVMLSDPNLAPGANNHGMHWTGDEETDAPCTQHCSPGRVETAPWE